MIPDILFGDPRISRNQNHYMVFNYFWGEMFFSQFQTSENYCTAQIFKKASAVRNIIYISLPPFFSIVGLWLNPSHDLESCHLHCLEIKIIYRSCLDSKTHHTQLYLLKKVVNAKFSQNLHLYENTVCSKLIFQVYF